MNLVTFIVLIILVLIVNFFEKKYVKLSMILHTIFILGIIMLLNGTILAFIFISSKELPLILKLFLISISLLPIVFIREYIAHTIRIFDFYMNRRKILENGSIQKGVIQEIKSYGFRQRHTHGYYLIVDLDGEKIKSLPFGYYTGRTMQKNVYEDTSSNLKFHKERMNGVLNVFPRLYNVGDEIDIIVYHNKKYVMLD